MFLLWVTLIWHSAQCLQVIKSGNEWHAGVDRSGLGTKQDFYSFVFLYTCSNFMTGSESSSYNCRIWIFAIFYSKFQLLSTFSICSKFCVEN